MMSGFRILSCWMLVPEEVDKTTFHFGVLARLDEGKIVYDSRIGLSHLSKFFPQPSSCHWKVCWVCADGWVHAPVKFIWVTVGERSVM